MRYWRKFRNTRGAVLVFVAILLVVLIGMAALAIDVGRMYIARQRAQNVCDGSTLAGGAYLDGTSECTEPDGLATITAQACAIANNELTAPWEVLAPGTTDPGVEVTFPTGTVPDDAGREITDSHGSVVQFESGEVIRVHGQVDVDFTFARIFGLSGTQVEASATAIFGPALEVCDLVPLAVSDLIIFGDGVTPPLRLEDEVLVILHVPDHTEGFLGPGNYLSLRFEDDSGANDYRNRLAGDATGACLSADPPSEVDTEPGYMGQATYKGLIDRLRKEENPLYVYDPINNPNAWQNWRNSEDPDTGMYDGTWRIVILPVIKDTVDAVSGMKPVEVVGMVGFFIEQVYHGTEEGTDEYDPRRGDVTGYFLQGIKIGEDIRWIFPTSTPPNPQFIQELRLIS